MLGIYNPLNALIQYYISGHIDLKLLISMIISIVSLRRKAYKRGILLPLLVNSVETALVREIQSHNCQQSISSPN